MRKCCLMLLAGLLLCLCGCSNYVEMEELIIVSGAAIDYDKETQQYTVTAEVIDLQSSSGRENSYQTTYLSSDGASPAEAVASMSRIAGRQLYWGHASVFLLGRNVLEYSIRPVLDWFLRDATARLSSMVVAVETEKAADIYQLKSPVQKSISLSLEEILENFRTAKSRTAVHINELINLCGVKGAAICMPMVRAEKNVEADLLVIDSYAVLKQDSLSGIYEDADVAYLMLLLENPMQNVLSVAVPDSEITVRIRVLEHSVALEVSEQNGRLHTDIALTVNVSIVGTEGNADFLRDGRGNKILSEAAAKAVVTGCTAVLERDVTQYRADVLSIGRHISRRDPALWQRVKADWDQTYADMTYAIHANVRIDLSGETSPINDQEAHK